MDKSKTSIQTLDPRCQHVSTRYMVHILYRSSMTQTIMFNRTSDLMQSVPQEDHVV